MAKTKILLLIQVKHNIFQLEKCKEQVVHIEDSFSLRKHLKLYI